MRTFCLLSTVCACTLTMTSAAQSAAMLEAQWEFDGDYTAVNDPAWNGSESASLNAKGNGAFVDGVQGQAAHFDGGSVNAADSETVDHVDSDKQTPSNDYNGGLSIMGWIKQDEDVLGRFLSHDQSCCTYSEFGFGAYVKPPGKLELLLRSPPNIGGRMYGESDDNVLQLGEWNHIAFTWNGSTTGGIEIFVNGNRVSTNLRFINSGLNGNPFAGLYGSSRLPHRIGAGQLDSVNRMQGYVGDIDHLSVWKGVLTAQEILDDYEATAPVTDPIKAIENLAAVVLSLNLKNGISNSLDAKLDSALNALDDLNENNDIAAINSLHAFINAVYAQSGNAISEEDADLLIAAAQAVIDLLTSTD